MKITLTEEGKEICQSLERNFKLEPIVKSTKKKNKFPITELNQYKSLPNIPLPSLKNGATAVTVKMPRIRISKDFEVKYPLDNNTTKNSSFINIASEQPGNIPHETENIYVKHRLSAMMTKAKDIKELARINDNYKKIVGIHNTQLKRWENIRQNIDQSQIRAEAEMTEKVEKFRISFEDMIRKFEKELLINTSKKRKKERIGRFCLCKYNNIWDRARSTLLSVPKLKKTKYIDLLQNH